MIAFEPTPPSRWNDKIPRDLETICLKCLQKTASRRYASAQALADDLERFLTHRPIFDRQIHESLHERMAVPEAEAVPATLGAGWNTLLVRVANVKGEHALYLRLSDRTTN